MTVDLNYWLAGLAVVTGIGGLVSYLLGQMAFAIFWLVYCLLVLCVFAWPIIEVVI